MPRFFLAKTDPETYSISDFAKEKETYWDGVHNYTALIVIRSWEIGDRILIYHSLGEARIVGLAEVITAPEKNEADPRPSWHAKLRFIKEFPEEQKISLKQVKESHRFDDFMLVRQGRLSTMACPDEFVAWLREMGMEV